MFDERLKKDVYAVVPLPLFGCGLTTLFLMPCKLKPNCTAARHPLPHSPWAALTSACHQNHELGVVFENFNRKNLLQFLGFG